MIFLGFFHLILPFQNAASYGLNRCCMISASPIASICFQISSVIKPSSPVLGVAFLFMPHRIRMPKVLYPVQSNSLSKEINHYPVFSILSRKFMFGFWQTCFMDNCKTSMGNSYRACNSKELSHCYPWSANEVKMCWIFLLTLKHTYYACYRCTMLICFLGKLCSICIILTSRNLQASGKSVCFSAFNIKSLNN